MRSLVLAGIASILVSCVEIPDVPDAGPVASDGGGAVDAGGPFDAGPPPADASAPTVTVTSPRSGATFASAVTSVEVTGTAADDVAVAAVQVALGPNAFVAAASDDFFRTWRVTLPLPPGAWTVRARAFDAAGKMGEAQITITRTPRAGDLAGPVLNITSPIPPVSGPPCVRTTRQAVIVTGTATDDTGIALVQARVDNLTSFATVETGDTFASWRASLGLTPSADNLIRVRATDLSGRTAEKTVCVTSLVAADREPPELVVTAPAEGASIAAATVEVAGTARDNLGVAKVEVSVNGGALLAGASTDNFATWRVTVPLAPGANALRVRATDVSELETVVTRNVTGAFTPEWSASREYELRLAAPRDRSVTLDLDKNGLGEVIPESVARTIKLLDLDPTPLMTSTMETIKNACGPGWDRASFDPSGCPWPAGTPERNMWGLLTMTPDNVKVDCTSIAETKQIANDIHDAIGLLDSFSDILAETLGIGRYQEIVGTTHAVASIKENVLRTHPNANPDGTLPVTMQDGLSDMADLATRFGRSGSHPGFLSAAQSKVLCAGPDAALGCTEAFRMSVRGVSNLTWHDGVDLSVGKEYIALLPTSTADVISFDFANTLSVSGLVPNPKVDMTFTMFEHSRLLRAYTTSNGTNPRTLPMPRNGPGEAWTIDKWLTEYVLVDATYRQYASRSPYCRLYEIGSSDQCSDQCLAIDLSEIVVGRNGVAVNDGPLCLGTDPYIARIPEPVPLGWTRFWTRLDLGSPPPAQYLWEMIAEIAQIRLHDGGDPSDCSKGIPEGQANSAFAVADIPVGLTAQQIIDKMRPSLEAQKSVLAQRLLGDYRRNNGAVDFYLRGTAGDLYLFFVHATDPRPLDTYGYTKPGFFSDAALTQKVSTTAAMTSGDGVHEKVKLGATPQTVYAQDDAGAVYRIEVGAAQSDRVTLRVAKKL
jgi:hypothetical protein